MHITALDTFFPPINLSRHFLNFWKFSTSKTSCRKEFLVYATCAMKQQHFLFVLKLYSIALFDVPLLCVRRNNEPSFPVLRLSASSYRFTTPVISPHLFSRLKNSRLFYDSAFIQSHSLTLIIDFPCRFHSCCVLRVETETSIQDMGKAWMSEVPECLL